MSKYIARTLKRGAVCSPLTLPFHQPRPVHGLATQLTLLVADPGVVEDHLGDEISASEVLNNFERRVSHYGPHSRLNSIV